MNEQKFNPNILRIYSNKYKKQPIHIKYIVNNIIGIFTQKGQKFK